MEVVLKSLRNNWNSISPCCPFDFETLERVIEFIFDSNFTIFNGTYYKQIFGTPMGSKISPILVNFVLDDLVKDCLHYMPHHIPFVKRYVDDLLLAVPKDQIGMTLEFFNTYDRHIQFTVEEETNRAVPFLDMLVMRTENNILKTKWYRKPYCSNRFISYHSYHTMKSKINLILGMKSRAVKLSHSDYVEESVALLKNILIDNSYP